VSGPGHRRVTVEGQEATSRRLLSEATSTPWRKAVAALVVATVAFRAWTFSQWSWYADDWGWFRDQDSMSALDFIFRGYNSHLQPGQFAIMWPMGQFDPLDHTWGNVATSVLVATALISWALAFRELFGERMHLLAGLAVIALSPALTGVSLWWASAVQNYILQTVMGLAVWWLARWLQGGERRSDLIGLAVTFAVGLFFWEKSVLVAIPLAFVVLMVGRGSLGQRLRLGVRALWPVAVIAAGYLALYVFLVQSGHMGPTMSSTKSRGFGEAVSFYAHGLLDMAVPALVGGPFVDITRPGDFYPAASTVEWVLLGGLTLLGLAGAFRYRRRSAWAATMVLVYAVVAWGLVLFNQRYDFFENDTVRAPSYLPDVLAVLVLAAMFMVTATDRAPAEESWRRAVGAERGRQAHTVLTHVLAGVVLLCAVNTGRAFAAVNETSPAPYWDTLRHDAENVGPATINDSQAPGDLVGGIIVNDDGNLSSLLVSLDLPLKFNVPTPRYLMANEEGHLMLATMRDDAVVSLEGESDCDYPVVVGDTTSVRLDRDAFGFGWVVELTYFSEADMTVAVSTEAANEVEVELPATAEDQPISTMQFHIEGEVKKLDIEGLEGEGTLCVTDAQIGLLQPSLLPPPALKD
jgi:hypothetical protein